MPVYNGEAFLRDAIKSVLDQSFRDFELLIVNDGSTDGSAGIISSFSDSRIRVINNPARLKLSGALNRGMENALGKYIARMDADDVSVPTRLEAQFDFMESYPEIGMCGGRLRSFGKHPSSGTVFKFPESPEEIKAWLLFDNPFAHPTVMWRRDVFDKSGLRFDGSYYPAEDYELWTRALEHVQGANIARVLLNYRLHPESMTLSGLSDMDAQAMKILRGQFAGLGMSPSEDEIKFHRYISTNRLAPGWTKESVDRAEKWLLQLGDANDSCNRHSGPRFNAALGRVWFNVCYRSLSLGFRVTGKYAFSSLMKRRGTNRASKLIMYLAALKFRLNPPGTGGK